MKKRQPDQNKIITMETEHIATHAFKEVFESIDKHGVKNGVDEKGIDG